MVGTPTHLICIVCDRHPPFLFVIELYRIAEKYFYFLQKFSFDQTGCHKFAIIVGVFSFERLVSFFSHLPG